MSDFEFSKSRGAKRFTRQLSVLRIPAFQRFALQVSGLRPSTLGSLISGFDWCQHEEGVIAFQNEVIKSVYYRPKY